MQKSNMILKKNNTKKSSENKGKFPLHTNINLEVGKIRYSKA
jgi:hypothetical protein